MTEMNDLVNAAVVGLQQMPGWSLGDHGGAFPQGLSQEELLLLAAARQHLVERAAWLPQDADGEPIGVAPEAEERFLPPPMEDLALQWIRIKELSGLRHLLLRAHALGLVLPHRLIAHILDLHNHFDPKHEVSFPAFEWKGKALATALAQQMDSEPPSWKEAVPLVLGARGKWVSRQDIYQSKKVALAEAALSERASLAQLSWEEVSAPNKARWMRQRRAASPQEVLQIVEKEWVKAKDQYALTLLRPLWINLGAGDLPFLTKAIGEVKVNTPYAAGSKEELRAMIACIPESGFAERMAKYALSWMEIKGNRLLGRKLVISKQQDVGDEAMRDGIIPSNAEKEDGPLVQALRLADPLALERLSGFKCEDWMGLLIKDSQALALVQPIAQAAALHGRQDWCEALLRLPFQEVELWTKHSTSLTGRSGILNNLSWSIGTEQLTRILRECPPATNPGAWRKWMEQLSLAAMSAPLATLILGQLEQMLPPADAPLEAQDVPMIRAIALNFYHAAPDIVLPEAHGRLTTYLGRAKGYHQQEIERILDAIQRRMAILNVSQHLNI